MVGYAGANTKALQDIFSLQKGHWHLEYEHIYNFLNMLWSYVHSSILPINRQNIELKEDLNRVFLPKYVDQFWWMTTWFKMATEISRDLTAG